MMEGSVPRGQADLALRDALASTGTVAPIGQTPRSAIQLKAPLDEVDSPVVRFSLARAHRIKYPG
jgi:hypothetical protein